MFRSLLLLAASTALLANSAPADTLTQLTDCKLNYQQAAAAVGTLVSFRTLPGDLISVEKDEVTEYDASGLSVLGTKPTNYFVNDIIDGAKERHVFRATLAMPYAQARQALILRQGKQGCDTDNSGIIKSCFFELPRDTAGNFDVTLSVMQVNAQESQVYCNYHRGD